MKKTIYLLLILLPSIVSAQLFTNYNAANDGLLDDSVTTITVDENNIKWLGSRLGLSSYNDNSFTNYTTANGLLDGQVTSIAIDAADNKWIGLIPYGFNSTATGGLSKFDGTTFTNYTTADGLVNNYVNALTTDAIGNLWIGTSGGLSKFDGTTFTNYTTADGLLYYDVNALTTDAIGNIWIGTGAGISKFDGTTFTNYTTDDGLVYDYVTSLTTDAIGNLWIGTSGGLSKFDGTTFTNYTTDDGLVYDYVNALTTDAIGNLWIGNWNWNGGGISKFDGTTFTNYTTADGLSSVIINTCKVDNQGALYIGTGESGLDKMLTNSCNLSSGTETENQIICFGAAITPISYSVSSSSSVTGLPVNLTFDPNPTSGSPNISGTPAQSGTYIYTIMDSTSGCTSSGKIQIDTLLSTTASAGGSQTICVNSSATVSGATTNSTNINWSENGAGSITAGINSLTPTYTPAQNDAGNTVTLTMTVADSNACGAQSATASYTVMVESTPTPTASAGGSQTICVNSSATVSGATTNSTNINWTENGAGSITAGINSLTPTYTPTQNDAGNTITLTMSVVDSSNSCGPQSATASYTIIVDSIPTPTASAGGSQSICVNSSATVSGATTNSANINWSENGAGSITAGINSLTPTYTPAQNDAGNTVTLTMTVVDSNACGAQSATASYTVMVESTPTPTASAGGSQTICPDDSTSVSDASTSVSDIIWTENGAGNIVSGINGLTPTYFSTQADAGNTVTLTMTVTDSNACGAQSATASYDIIVKNMPNGTLTGDSYNSDGNSLPRAVFSGTEGTPAYTFVYTVNGGSPESISTSNNSDTASVNVPVSTTTEYSYKLLSISDQSGCSRSFSGTDSVVFQINPINGINDPYNNAIKNAFPNPFTNQLTVSALKPNADIQVVNMLGRVIYKTKSNTLNTVIDTEDYPAGVYFIRVTNEFGSNTVRVIKR